jgi:hypothetical protein
MVNMATLYGHAGSNLHSLRPFATGTAWMCIFTSAALHLAYNLQLLQNYRMSGLSSAYSIARGTRSAARPEVSSSEASLSALRIPNPLNFLYFALGEFDLRRCNVLFQMLERIGARDRQHHRRFVEQPSE